MPLPLGVIVRDGRDALVSYAHFALSAEAVDDYPTRYLDMLTRMVSDPDDFFHGWKRHVEAWLDRPRTALLRFEALIADPVGEVRRATARLGLRLAERSDIRIPSFAEMHGLNARLMRRGQVGSWRDEMPAWLEAAFWERNGPTMTALGYSR